MRAGQRPKIGAQVRFDAATCVVAPALTTRKDSARTATPAGRLKITATRYTQNRPAGTVIAFQQLEMALDANRVRAATRKRPWIGKLVRLGYLSKGFIYILIGLLALRVAVGMRGRLTDPSGILIGILRQPFGAIMLAVIGAGILAYAAYYIVEAVADLKHRGGGVKGWTSRSLTIIKAVAYGSIGVQAMNIVLRNRRPSPTGGAESAAQQVLSFPLGDVALVLIGIGIVIYACAQLRMVWLGGVDDDVDVARIRREAAWLLPFGRLGTGARSVILLLIGGTLLWAGWSHHPQDADGYGEALRFIASLHPVLLAAVGAGLLCFGVYEGCQARYAKL